ncbi:hypothetical protein Sta7437_3978 [Stanieria cyanosphaera PCC 7437]|uniref:Uncharacterized protein n=1 Tax=Stanieria cyanosphaera (strain ATCC 29371 / PCC 7437) TaxID=111780 RepID=K9XXY2_STAC7|nr:Npun_F0494 family protein [Stanieria cyanosphaera]AFZ37460.1 hypothetical protein Sta7437_3978 [Stanieria cyanosphaera PCC 7437]
MSFLPARAKQSVSYSSLTITRAEIALCCSSFKLSLFTAMLNHGVPLPTIAESSGLQNNYTKKALSENQAEAQLIWLIKVGVLRREVDGQGLTDSFRLTPLGRQIVTKWEKQGNSLPNPTMSERIINLFNRWSRLSL